MAGHRQPRDEETARFHRGVRNGLLFTLAVLWPLIIGAGVLIWCVIR